MEDAAGGLMGLVWLAIMVVMIVSFWKVFTKAGQPGWVSIIPIYNLVVLLQIVRKPVWWVVLFFIPLVNIIIAIIVFHALSQAFGKGAGFTVGLIFLGFIFYPILAFGDAEYQHSNAPV